MYIKKPKNEYVLYKGDTYLYGGTIEQVAKYLKVSTKTINYYASPSYKRRKVKDDSNRYVVYKVKIEE